MRNKSMMLGLLLSIATVALPQASLAADNAPKQQVTAQQLATTPPDATVTFEAEQLRLIFGGSSGKGVLTFKGKKYPFTIKGVSVGGVGYSKVEGTGTVHFLKKIEDFSGDYNAIGIGAVLGAGKGGSTFENGKGVIISTISKASGLALNLGLGEVKVTLDK